MEIEIGKSYILNRPPFILKGVIVQYRSIVQVKSKSQDGLYTVLYTDKEGYIHELSDITKEELETQGPDNQ